MPASQPAMMPPHCAGTATSIQQPANTDATINAIQMPPDAARLAGTLVLRDGTRVRTRPIHADDTERLCDFHAHLSRDTVIFRFFRYMPELPVRDANHFTHIDYEDRMALVATQGEGEQERILAVVRYDRIAPTSAEVAFVVADAWQGHGIASALLLQLAEYARARGIERLVAITMSSNARMLEVLRHCGFPSTTCFHSGEDEVCLDISAPPAPLLAPLPFIPDSAL